jgi:signal transduction histidine kinase
MFFSRFFHSYKGKWLIAIFSICFMMFFLLIFDRIVITHQFLYQREIQRVNHVGSLLMDFIGDNMLQHDTNDIKMIIKKSMEEPDITLVSVLDTNKIIRYSSRKEIIGKTNPFIDSGIDAVHGDMYYKTFPLNYENTNLGFVQVGYSLGKIRQNFSTSFYRILFIELLLFCAILFFAWRITESLLRPLSEMKDVSNKIAQGDFSIRAKVTSRDSIGELAGALNDMARQLGDLSENMNKKINQATRDLTSSNEELRKKTVELEESNRKLLELDTLKSDFVSLVSHELKTPLTLIIGFAKTILTLDLTEEQKVKYLNIIGAEGKRLAQLVENYLDITNIEAGTLSLVREKVNVNDLVREVVEYFTREPGRRIDLKIPPDLGLIEGDGERLKRVLFNLLENALRYGPAQETVVISAQELTDSLVLSVTDKGPGVKKEEREKIFDKFFRGADTITQRTKGSGLGLAIAKGIVEAHGGTLWVESEPGMGATFCFSVPKNA